jgi:hypothetical protein
MEKMACWMPILGESVFRFDESEMARQKTPPSLSFANPELREERVDTSSFDNKTPVLLPEIQVHGEQQTVVFKVCRLQAFCMINGLDNQMLTTSYEVCSLA